MSSRAEKTEGARVATWIFRVCLGVSIGVNATVGWLQPGELHPGLAASMHALFPVLLALAETLLVRVPTAGSKTVDAVRYVGGGAIALTAFAGSAKSLHAFAVLGGFDPAMAWGLPVIIDLLMAVSMITAVALAAPKRAAKSTAVKASKQAPTSLPPLDSRKPETSTARSGGGRVSPEVVAEALVASPGVSMSVLADRLGCSVRTLRRHKAKAIEQELLPS